MQPRDEETISRFRRNFEAFGRGDFDAVMETVHPEVEFFRPGGQTPLKGAEAMRAWMEPDALEDQRYEPLEFRLNANKVLIHLRTSARGVGSGIELDAETWVVWTLDDDGLTTRIEVFDVDKEAEALEAAGLSE